MIDAGGYRIRPSRDALSEAEVSCLKALEVNDALPKNILSLDVATLFKGLRDQLEVWPMFFRSKEACGKDMQQGLVTLWSNFMIAVSTGLCTTSFKQHIHQCIRTSHLCKGICTQYYTR